MSRLLPIVVFALTVGCQRGAAPAGPTPLERLDRPGLHNVYRINDRLLSGSSPEGEAGFRSLQELGVKTIISVDGARPDLAQARTFGLRYVHLPVGYDGIPRAQVLRLAKAVRALPGPVYIHCHHGKHRGPAAAAAIHLCLDPRCSLEQAVAEMKQIGTDPHYQGLYDVPRTLKRPTTTELDALPVDFPEVAAVSNLTQLMVEIDARWLNLTRLQKAAWKPLPGNPDLDPPHEALMLVEHYREMGRLPTTKARPPEFRELLTKAEVEAAQLATALRKKAGVSDAFQKVKGSCNQCHRQYRDSG